MTKAGQGFDESEIHLHGFIIRESDSGDCWFVINTDRKILKKFIRLEKAIIYCLEN